MQMTMCQELKLLRNYHALCAIVSGFTNSTVTRLKLVCANCFNFYKLEQEDFIKRKGKEDVWHECAAFVSPQNNFVKYREELSEAVKLDLPAVPSLRKFSDRVSSFSVFISYVKQRSYFSGRKCCVFGWGNSKYNFGPLWKVHSFSLLYFFFFSFFFFFFLSFLSLSLLFFFLNR